MQPRPEPMLLCIAMLAALLAGLGCPSHESPRPGSSPQTVTPIERVDPLHVTRMAEMAALADREDVALLFLGDSITQGWEDEGRYTWNRYYVPRRAANFGVDGDRTANLLWRIESGSLDGLAPALTVLLIGTNDTHDTEPAALALEVSTIVAALRERLPGSRILLLGLLPKHPDPESPIRRDLHGVNHRLSLLADDEVVFFRDLGGAFLEPDGRLDARVMPDYLHPGPLGYRIFAEALEPMLADLLAEPAVR